MKATKKLTGACEHCGGPIEFGANSIGLAVPCPYCRKSTGFHLAAPPEEPAIPGRIVVWTVIAIVILVCGLLASLFGLKLMEKKVAERQQQRDGVSAPGAR